MPRISRRMAWLNKLFPPAQPDPLNPGFISDDIVLVHPVLGGSERFGEIQLTQNTGAAGVTFLNSADVPEGKWWWVLDCSVHHNDPVARDSQIQVQTGSTPLSAVASFVALPTALNLAVPRSFVVGEGSHVRFECLALAAAQQMTSHFHHLELDIGEPISPGG